MDQPTGPPVMVQSVYLGVHGLGLVTSFAIPGARMSNAVGTEVIVEWTKFINMYSVLW